MRFEKYLNSLNEMAIKGNPDKYYTKPGAITWVYDNPYLFWFNPEEGELMKNNQVVKNAKNMPKDLRKGEWLTHSDIHRAVGIMERFGEDIIHGRISPDGREMGIWGYTDPEMRSDKAWERQMQKAISAVYKHVKDFIK